MTGLVSGPAWVWLLIAVVIAAVVLAGYTVRYRTIPGARWLTAMNLAVAVYTTTYVLSATTICSRDALVVLEHAQLALGTLSVACWFLFVLAYTGRAELLGRLGNVVAVAGLCLVLIVDVTGPVHGLVFSDVVVDLSGEVPVVSTEPDLVYALQLLLLFTLSPVGLVFLHRSLSEHDQLFSGQALALLLGSVSPYVIAGIEVLDLEPIPAMPLLPLGFGCMSLAFTYAAARHRLFEFVPATRRVGEARALQQLEEGVIVVATDGTVLQANESACQLLHCERSDCLGEAMATLHDIGSEGPVDVPPVIERRGRTLETNRSVVEGPMGDVIGYAIVYQDVSETRRQQQRITVLNRLLRHNLRNEFSVVEGHLGLLVETDDEAARNEAVGEIEAVLDEITDLSRKARAIERHLSVEEHTPERVPVTELAETVVEDVEGRYPAADIEVDVPAGLTLVTMRQQLDAGLDALVENAVEHNDSPTPWAELAAETSGEGIAFVVSDDGPGIPRHEIESLDVERESPLSHGSGLGLWLVRWLVAVLGGDLDFEVTDDGTAVRVWIPDRSDE